MNLSNINEVFTLYRKEKETNNVLFTLKSQGHDIDDLCIRHTSLLYSILRILSSAGFNEELENPIDTPFIQEEVIKSSLNDLSYYSELLRLYEPEIMPVACELIQIKKNLLENVIFQSVYATADESSKIKPAD